MKGFFSESLISDKHTNAFIIDSNNEGYFVKIKFVIGNLFFCEIKNQSYWFKLEGSRQINVKIAIVKNYKFYIFFTEHFLPVSGADMKNLEDVLRKNSLPNVDMQEFAMLKLLGSKEKHDEKEFKKHSLSELIEKIATKQKDYPKQTQELTNFINDLKTDHIVTPVKRLSEFLQEDLLTTNAGFLGNVRNQFKLTDKEQKKMSNTPEKGKVAWLKIMLVVMLVVGVGAVGYIVYSSGMIQGISLPGATVSNSGGPMTDAQIMVKYPHPEDLKCAIAKGNLDYKTLSPTVKAMADKTKMPSYCP